MLQHHFTVVRTVSRTAGLDRVVLRDKANLCDAVQLHVLLFQGVPLVKSTNSVATDVR